MKTGVSEKANAVSQCISQCAFLSISLDFRAFSPGACSVLQLFQVDQVVKM